jgi:hypothetical protein
MVNYDLPWNPNRLEQRFGRIHRFGQREVCHLWNLVAYQTREGAVYRCLFEKLEEERAALGGKVFDVLGRVFTEVALRDLMLEAIHYNNSAEAFAATQRKIEAAGLQERVRQIVAERALDATTLSAAHLRELRDRMQRAEARRLVPHFVETFFVAAFSALGGSIVRREPGRYEVSHVPAELRRRDRTIGRGEPVVRSYERICFDKANEHLRGKPQAKFIGPGHPLLEAVIDVYLERYRDVLKRGAILVDESNETDEPRVLFAVDSTIVDGRTGRDGNRKTISRRVEYLEVDLSGRARAAGPAPYLDYRPLRDEELEHARAILEAAAPGSRLKSIAFDTAIERVVNPHLTEIREARHALIRKTRAEVRARLTSEIQYWDHRAEELRLREEAGETPRINSENARRRCDQLEERLERRMRELELEEQIDAQPPRIEAAAFVVPAALLAPAPPESDPAALARETRHIERIAMDHVMELERAAGRSPRDVSADHLGWDIESREPGGALRFIEVKGRRIGAETISMTFNEVLAARNQGERYYLAVVIVDGDRVVDSWSIADPLRGDPNFAVVSQVFDLARLRSRLPGEAP